MPQRRTVPGHGVCLHNISYTRWAARPHRKHRCQAIISLCGGSQMMQPQASAVCRSGTRGSTSSRCSARSNEPVDPQVKVRPI
jgi:hypothetical protein